MIILSATMWPGGNASGSYELFHGTITNQGASDGGGDAYMAHVLARPHTALRTPGFEADVEVKNHHREYGFVPLLDSIIQAVRHGDGYVTGASRVLARLTIEDAASFEKIIRGRQ